MRKTQANSESILAQIYTATEAAVVWNLSESAVRKAISYGKFQLGIDYRKAGTVTIITRQAMERVYGELPIHIGNND